MSRGPNPLVPGFNPDPSIVLADDAYYLVTSSFEYLPGIPVYRSTDLVEWEQIGNVATRPEQLQIGDVPTGLGVWAPRAAPDAASSREVASVRMTRVRAATHERCDKFVGSKCIFNLLDSLLRETY